MGVGECLVDHAVHQSDALGAEFPAAFVPSPVAEEVSVQAIEIFRINADLYPDSWNVYDSLGEALLRAGNTDEAVAMYERSLVLNPENTNGKEVLAGIRNAA